MSVEQILTYLSCALIVGLVGWMFSHTVDRRIHLNGQKLVSEELFRARLQGLEDRLIGRITAVSVRLEDLEKNTNYIHQRLERFSER